MLWELWLSEKPSCLDSQPSRGTLLWPADRRRTAISFVPTLGAYLELSACSAISKRKRSHRLLLMSFGSSGPRRSPLTLVSPKPQKNKPTYAPAWWDAPKNRGSNVMEDGSWMWGINREPCKWRPAHAWHTVIWSSLFELSQWCKAPGRYGSRRRKSLQWGDATVQHQTETGGMWSVRVPGRLLSVLWFALRFSMCGSQDH